MPPTRLLLILMGAGVIVAPRAALATSDLGADVRALTTARAAYGHVVRLKPRLLERGERLPIAVPAELLNPKDASCTTVAVLGVEALHFVVRFSEFDPGAPSTAFPESSAAGAIDITRCGATKPFLGDLSIELRSPRGVVETLLVNAPAGVPPLIESLPNRDPGTDLALGDPGPRPALAPVAERMQRLAARARRTGASFEHEDWRARDDGSGGAILALSAGCHELTLLDTTQATPGAPPVDLDLELVGEEGGAPLAVDRSENADATGSICVGSASNVELRFAGATPNARLLLARAHWDLPPGVPAAWGAEARAKFAGLARARHFVPKSSPIYQSLGVQGTTSLPLEIEPSACYTVLLVPLRGEAQALSLSALGNAPGEAARGTADVAGSGVSFCAHGSTLASLEVDGRGTSLAWILAAWETGRSAPGLAEP